MASVAVSAAVVSAEVVSVSKLQRHTAVIAYFSSKQICLFTFALQTAVTAYFSNTSSITYFFLQCKW